MIISISGGTFLCLQCCSVLLLSSFYRKLLQLQLLVADLTYVFVTCSWGHREVERSVCKTVLPVFGAISAVFSQNAAS